jgi:hypothetical protein
MPMALLLLSLGAIVAVLGLWAFWIAPRLPPQRLDTAQKSAMIAFQTVAALAIASAGILYLDEQQWSPRLGVELKAEPQLVPGSNPKSAVIQVAIAITNKTETNQKVNFILVSAAGISGPARQDPKLPQDLAASPIYRLVTSRANDIGPDETNTQYVEIPIPCGWSLVRVVVTVPRPPAEPPQPGKARIEYERRTLVPLGEVCGNGASGPSR